ncbi:hypothetical protein GP484_06305 [Mammaliicoccus sciuri]|uniref:hypothetical protein n=1 Tax=Mammaliicoccus sciuri TaxID=1296 RepID=UPI001E58322F|nr:hypothetical protein [Mammaliicoccus sciuri]MCD3219472.1 hypothetical protein [Mammaliicoccus sciuri]
MCDNKLTVNYPFEKIFDKRISDLEFDIETPWIDEDEFWDVADVEILVNDTDPFMRAVKTDYKNGFKLFVIENDYKVFVKTNWALDKLPNGSFLPRIQ